MHSIIWSIGPRNKSGVILQPCWTPLPTANQLNNTPSAQTQLHVSVYRASMKSTFLLCRIRLCSSFYKALWSTESKAIWNSFLLWMTVFNVIIRSIVDRPGITHSALFYGVLEAGRELCLAVLWRIPCRELNAEYWTFIDILAAKIAEYKVIKKEYDQNRYNQSIQSSTYKRQNYILLQFSSN